ncbi:MAG: hypothetical protein ACI4KR_01160 [Ruminiclostridium sp.]
MNEFLMIVIAVAVIIVGVTLLYFLLNKFFAKEDKKPNKPQKSADIKSKADDGKKSRSKPAEAAKKAADEAAKEKAEKAEKAAAEKRRAEMLKKTVIEADPKVLEHSVIRRAVSEITAEDGAIDLITVMANRIDRSYKEGTGKEPVSVFFDSPSLSRLEQGEMKLVAEHIYNAVKSRGFELKEIGSGEKGTYRYHIDKYEIKAL